MAMSVLHVHLHVLPLALAPHTQHWWQHSPGDPAAIKHAVEDVKRRKGIASLHLSLPVCPDAQQASNSLEFNVEIFEMTHNIVEVLGTIVNNA